MSEVTFNCPLCSGNDLHPFITLPDANGVLAKLWQCLDCYCHVPAMVHHREDTSPLERQVKFHEQLWSQCTEAEMEQVRADLYQMIHLLQAEIGQPSSDRYVIELGCGRGSLLRALLDHGYNAIGCEPAHGLVAMAREHYALGEEVLFAETADSFLDRIVASPRLPDVIIIWHVLEHVQAPLRLLKRLAEALSPSGKLILQLPLLHSPYIFPEHNFFVTPQTFAKLSACLGGRSYHFAIDSSNKFITVFFGPINLQRDAQQDDHEDVTWRGARARAEPILTRDLAINDLHNGLSQQSRVVLKSQEENALLLKELGEQRQTSSEQSMRLEWHSKIDSANAKLIRSLEDEAGALKVRLSTDEREIAQLKKIVDEQRTLVSATDQAIDAQMRMFEQNSTAMELMENEIRVGNEAIVRLLSEIDELKNMLKQERETVSKLKQESDKKSQTEENLSKQVLAQRELIKTLNQEVQKVNEEVIGQAHLICERNDTLQDMGREALKREERIQEQDRNLSNLTEQLQGEHEQTQSLEYRFRAAVEYVDRLRQNAIARAFSKIGLIGAPPNFSTSRRSLVFKERTHNRYWWHATIDTFHVPLIYDMLDDTEWTLLEEWFDDTEKKYQSTGEANIPPLSLMFGLISGNGISRIVQCGHYVGYSTLLLGFLLRKMGKLHALYSVDIDPEVTAYTNRWVSRARLSAQVRLAISDSAAKQEVENAERYLRGKPQLIFIDSSHQYEHTLRELDLWYSALCQGGLLVLHDTSQFAATLDKTGGGGVLRAVNEWCGVNRVTPFMLNSFVTGGSPGDYPYLDGCGLTIIQKN